MKLKLERLKIVLQTNEGRYGTDITFKNGLNIIRADNTFGKSTCVQSIIFALGLEGTLGPSRKSPLKSALVSKLKTPDGRAVLVNETRIFLEISNQQGTQITLERNAAEEKQRIISVRHGSISEIEQRKVTHREDYFVREHGAAAREKGFHNFLESFLEITEPKVIKYDGSFSPLYLESIFTVNYVEQTRGWGGILNILPTYLGIKDLSNRILEFTLNLDIQENNKKRQLLARKKSDLESVWRINVEKLITVARSSKAFVNNTLSEELSKGSFVDSNTDIYFFENNNKISAYEKTEALKKDLHSVKLQQLNNQNSKNNYPALEAELNNQLEKLSSIEQTASIIINDINISESYIDSIKKRTSAVNESLRKYKDIKKLIEYGSTEKLILTTKNVCPTCNQPLGDSLLPHMHNQEPLSVEENIKYLEKQKSVFESMISSEEIKLGSRNLMMESAKDQILETKNKIRNIKESLLEISGPPSRTLIRKEIELEDLISKIEKSIIAESEIKIKLEATLIEWKNICGAMEKLPWDGFSANDNIKIRTLAEVFRKNLTDFEYKSTEIESFEISRRTYKPAIDDVDLGSEASASDNIRVIWAYMYSLLVLDQEKNLREKKLTTNHLGLLILDEPRQQETKEVNFKTFIEKSASSGSLGKQIIIATSEKHGDLISMTKDLDVNIENFDAPIVSKII